MMAANDPAPDASSLGGHLDSILSEAAGMLDALSRCSRSSFGMREEDAPSLVGSMNEQRDQLELRLIDRMGGFVKYLPTIKSEIARCKDNLQILRGQADQLNLQETQNGFENAIRAQETQLQRASRQWPEVLDMVCEIATALQWSQGLPARRPASPHHPPAPASWDPPAPAVDGEIDSLMSMGPLGDH